jgi:acyl carrier protein
MEQKETKELELLGLRLRKEQRDLDEVLDSTYNAGGIESSESSNLGLEISDEYDCSMSKTKPEDLEALVARSEQLKLKIRAVNNDLNAKFNAHWGQLFKSGFQYSRFARQVINYACLHTSRATNLGFIWPNRSFKPLPDISAHDGSV